ncbi:MAG: TonB family protein [Bryobacterales bacterium]|nr:TonB family protein [Bryobacterales bacterium]
MKLAETPTATSPEPDFLLHLNTRDDTRRFSKAAIASVVLHLLVGVYLWNAEFTATPLRPSQFPDLSARSVTKLVVPADILKELTQKAPNTKTPAKEFDVQSLIPRPEAKKMTTPPVPARSPQPRSGVPQPSLPDAPQIATSAAPPSITPPPGLGESNTAPPPPPPAENAKPKISFETVTAAGTGYGNRSGGASQPKANIPQPKSGVQEAVAAVARRRGGGVVVGDDADPAPSLGESLSQQAAPGKMGSSLELLSDPQGADFRPYLLRVLAAVRRNWFAVIPESARLGRRGRVVIQFAIARDGNVPKLVIAVPSGAEPLDRAAVAGISASNPFPPLPLDFKGDQIRLQLSFAYNAQR